MELINRVVDAWKEVANFENEIAEDLKSFDMNKCNERFENFYQLHNLEVERLSGHRNLSSIGI